MRRTAAGTAVLLVALSVVAGFDLAVGAQGRTIKLATLVPSGSIWDKTLKTMGSDWATATGGRVNLRIYSGGVAGDDPDMVRKMRIGQLQAATVTVSGLTEIDPAFALFEIPLFFDSYDELFAVLERLGPELERRLEERGFVLLHWGQAGWIYFFTNRPATTIEEFRRLKIFVWAGDGRLAGLWREHGFRPVPLAATDILTGLESGLFDALPATPIAALSLQWFRSAPHMIDIGVTPLVGATIVTEKAWKTISEVDRAAMLEAAARAGEEFAAEIPRADRQAIDEMTVRGLEVLSVDAAARIAWQQLAVDFGEEMRRAFVPPEIYDLALAERDAYRERSREAAADSEGGG